MRNKNVFYKLENQSFYLLYLAFEKTHRILKLSAIFNYFECNRPPAERDVLLVKGALLPLANEVSAGGSEDATIEAIFLLRVVVWRALERPFLGVKISLLPLGLPLILEVSKRALEVMRACTTKRIVVNNFFLLHVRNEASPVCIPKIHWPKDFVQLKYVSSSNLLGPTLHILVVIAGVEKLREEERLEKVAS